MVGRIYRKGKFLGAVYNFHYAVLVHFYHAACIACNAV